jgi:CubicO group peptidase (beta-lactamase class C family)
MRLAEKGVLDLDKPVAGILDPWLAAQNLPSVAVLWGSNTEIKKVTSRLLLGMRAGFQDYHDAFLKNWTLTHPDDDFLPFELITRLNKTFIYTPDTGGSYSSDGYVLIGMVLAAITGAKDWSEFDQMAALGKVDPPFNETLFMKKGKCSKYPGVLHTYTTKGGGRDEEREVPSKSPFGEIGSAACSSKVYPGLSLVGDLAGNVTQGVNVSKCCNIAFEVSKKIGSPVVLPWTFSCPKPLCNFEPKSLGNCSVFIHPTAQGSKAHAVTGVPPPPPLFPSNFTDMYELSCLNGWTMGNLAASARDVAKFYHLLGTGKLVSVASLAQMQVSDDYLPGYR